MLALFAAGRFIQPSIKSVLNMILMSYKFEDTKGVIRSRRSNKDRQHNDQRKRRKGQTMIYKTLHRKLKIGQYKRRVSSLYSTSGTCRSCYY
jgi:vacuolar-type H+-ATPase subunit C/Vma6